MATSKTLMSSTLASLKNTMQEYVASGEIPGLIYLVERNGETAVGTLGCMEFDGPVMKRDTIVRISSMTKPITAVATMLLIEDGLLGLDQPVETILPELSQLRVLRNVDSPLHDTVPLDRSITVEDLLTFRMGTGLVLAEPGTYPIQRSTDARKLGVGPPNPAVPPEPDEWTRRFAELPLVRQPGESWMYVTSSEVLGVLLARASGKPLPDLLQERIFAPLGMSDTGFHVPEDKADRFATEYIYDEDTGGLVVSDPSRGGQWNRPPAFPSAGAGLVSTIDDFANFARMLLNDGVQNDRRFLELASVRQMTRNHLTREQREDGRMILGDGNGWGYGLAVRVEDAGAPDSIGSYGWSGGLGTTWLNDPAQRLIVILLTQVQWSSADGPECVRRFVDHVYQGPGDSNE